MKKYLAVGNFTRNPWQRWFLKAMGIPPMTTLTRFTWIERVEDLPEDLSQFDRVILLGQEPTESLGFSWNDRVQDLGGKFFSVPELVSPRAVAKPIQRHFEACDFWRKISRELRE